MVRRLALALLSIAVAASGAAAQHVWVVGPQPGPGVDFTAMQAAVNAAADGDTILVKLGAYVGNVAIANKRLVIHGLPGPAGSQPTITGTLWIGGLQADRSVVLRHLAFIPLPSDTATVLITNCDGPVLVEDCPMVNFSSGATAAPRVAHSSHVVFTRCYFTAPYAHNGFVSGVGLAGLELVSSDVALYDCTVDGSTGFGGEVSPDGAETPAEVGGPALRVAGGTVLLAGGKVRGGPGGWGDTDIAQPGACVPGASGGPGLVLDGGLVRRLDGLLAGGQPGFDAGCGTGSPGESAQLISGSIETVPAAPLRTLAITSPAIAGESAKLTLGGEPGELAFLLQSLTPLGSWSGALKGTLAGAAPYAIFVLGPLGPDGSLVATIALPDPLLPAGMETLLLIEQFATGAADGKSLSTPSAVVLLERP